MADGSGTKDDPWRLETPPGTSEYPMYRDETSDPPSIVCLPPLLEALGLAELTPDAKNNRMRAR
jgi:hypothetical protein